MQRSPRKSALETIPFLLTGTPKRRILLKNNLRVGLRAKINLWYDTIAEKDLSIRLVRPRNGCKSDKSKCQKSLRKNFVRE